MAVAIGDIKKLREETGAGVMDAKQALEETNGDMQKAVLWVQKKGVARAEKKADREAGVARVFAYVHHNGRVGGMVRIACETDFVARTEDFVVLGRELAMQVASMDPKGMEEFLKQDYLRDPSKTIATLVKETAGKLGENVTVEALAKL